MFDSGVTPRRLCSAQPCNAQGRNSVAEAKNNASWANELCDGLDRSVLDGKVAVKDVPSTLSRLRFAKGQLWGRTGRLALVDREDMRNQAKAFLALHRWSSRARTFWKTHSWHRSRVFVPRWKAACFWNQSRLRDPKAVASRRKNFMW